jgi:hypothetical protein
MTPPHDMGFCEEHQLLTYKVDEILGILHGWGALVRRIVAGLVIALILSAIGFVITVEIYMQRADAVPAQVDNAP